MPGAVGSAHPMRLPVKALRSSTVTDTPWRRAGSLVRAGTSAHGGGTGGWPTSGDGVGPWTTGGRATSATPATLSAQPTVTVEHRARRFSPVAPWPDNNGPSARVTCQIRAALPKRQGQRRGPGTDVVSANHCPVII